MDTTGCIVACESGQVNAGDGAQKPRRLPILFDGAAPGQSGDAPFHRALVDVRAHHPVKVKGRAGISMVLGCHRVTLIRSLNLPDRRNFPKAFALLNNMNISFLKQSDFLYLWCFHKYTSNRISRPPSLSENSRSVTFITSTTNIFSSRVKGFFVTLGSVSLGEWPPKGSNRLFFSCLLSASLCNQRLIESASRVNNSEGAFLIIRPGAKNSYLYKMHCEKWVSQASPFCCFSLQALSSSQPS